ncbi:MAG TPA: carboxypeptidase-like regulatory domain-containing protein [Bryobacteraceae bacterium]
MRVNLSFLAIATVTLYAQSNGVIEGRVTNSVTGEAVPGVKVRFLDRKSYVHYATTDASGSYRLTDLDDGDYTAEFTKESFSRSSQGSYSHVSSGLPVRVDMQLKPWGSLRGRVIDEEGRPAAAVRVERDPNPRRSLDGDTVTDQNGEFLFADLAPGSYTVAAKPEPKTRIQDGLRVGTVAIYYPSATDSSLAARLTVRVGENVSGIDIRLKSVPVHRVTGVVLNEAGKPAAQMIVKLMGPASTTRRELGISAIMIPSGAPGSLPMMLYSTVGPSAAPEIARVTTREDGAFEFAAVEPGDWRLSAETGDFENPLSGVASAPVSEKDLEGIQIRLSAPFPVQITQDWGGAQPPALPMLIQNGRVTTREVPSPRVNLVPVEGQPSVIVADPSTNMARVNSVFPGRYRVMPALGVADFYPAAIMLNGRDVSGQVVEVAPGAGPFQILYKSGLGHVRGTVEKGDGASVFLVSNIVGDILTYRQIPCGPGGAYDFTQVPPGEYYLAAFDRAESGGLPAADLPAAIVPFGSSVRVEANATVSADLRLNRWPW